MGGAAYWQQLAGKLKGPARAALFCLRLLMVRYHYEYWAHAASSCCSKRQQHVSWLGFTRVRAKRTAPTAEDLLESKKPGPSPPAFAGRHHTPFLSRRQDIRRVREKRREWLLLQQPPERSSWPHLWKKIKNSPLAPYGVAQRKGLLGRTPSTLLIIIIIIKIISIMMTNNS
jgi:hypothetical protein